MIKTSHEQLNALCDHLNARQAAIMQAWLNAIEADPHQATAHALSRGQLRDHIPQVLDAFERKLRARPGGKESRAADREKKQEEIKHGLHRWQQGYRLPELMREWGHLQICLYDELGVFAAANPEIECETMVDANRQMIGLVNEAISESSLQYERMQQAEAKGRMTDLEGALNRINGIERRRAALIREAVHDLHGNVFGVTVAAKILGESGMGEADRAEAAELLNQGVQSVTAMLVDLKELARLEAGAEILEIGEFDAAALVTELGNAHRLIAESRNLFLQVSGPESFVVMGDSSKVRRLLQNLLLNALKYTEKGGVTVSLGAESVTWWLMVKDTGPGILAGMSEPMVEGLKEATASARESDEKAAAIEGKSSRVLVPASVGPHAADPVAPMPGEGIGLSIVKRLCELLDGSLEMASSAEAGTVFRVVLPQKYRSSSPS